MDLNWIKKIWNLSQIEMLRLVRSTKMIILAVFLIFINIQVIAPLRRLSILMESKVSLLEPFAAIGNSGIIVLIMPLFFLTMMADFPREGNSQYFYQVRCSKRTWIAGQILYAVESSIALTGFVFASSCILSLDFTNQSLDYSYAVTRYVATFPERAGEYVVQLVPENLYNQIVLSKAMLHTAILLISYFLMLALIMLVFSLIKKKIIGILLDAFLIILGVITCAARATFMWIFPMAHTIIWMHYEKYQSKQVLLLFYSYLYFGVIDLALIVLSIVMNRRYNNIG